MRRFGIAGAKHDACAYVVYGLVFFSFLRLRGVDSQERPEAERVVFLARIVFLARVEGLHSRYPYGVVAASGAWAAKNRQPGEHRPLLEILLVDLLDEGPLGFRLVLLVSTLLRIFLLNLIFYPKALPLQKSLLQHSLFAPKRDALTFEAEDQLLLVPYSHG